MSLARAVVVVELYSTVAVERSLVVAQRDVSRAVALIVPLIDSAGSCGGLCRKPNIVLRYPEESD